MATEKTAPTLPAAMVSGGSSGLGLVIARQLLARGYAVSILGRDADRLEAARIDLAGANIDPSRLIAVVANATSPDDTQRAVEAHLGAFGRLDALVNVVGRSDRGRIEDLDAQTLRELFDANVVSAMQCSQACLPALRQTRGAIVNIGSLASRVAPRFLGGYVVVKHALAGLTRQMRMECEADGVHVGLVCPGPIAGNHSPNRYGVDADSNVPADAAAPGGGAKLKQLDPVDVADAVLRCIEKREIEIIMPAKTRLLMGINAISPKLADWILSRKSSK
ncbi:SDR family NAD(P)-dependent oxidoreductase [Rhodopirellula sp. SWK7]|uniref:SDR family NAD(P)-dependent oxidoreductase n=1 Tax=Rhodopirellula sp. SWK7 TaxID=595460 RepID=UPI0002BF8062|nr:SDR family oxidoreductase [Rhodopirellula sp. SWK7]EMI42636.1 short-chain dehydrogenase/reductase SDR [Rhodopirellula sp. SWK7]